MFLRTLAAVLLFALPAWAQTPADCTADVDLTSDNGIKVAVVYRCQSTTPVTFHAAGDRAVARTSEVKDGTGKPLTPSSDAWWVEPANGVAELHYRVDVSGYAADVNSPTLAIARGEGVLTLLEGWLLEPRGYKKPPTIDIKVKTAPGLSFSSGLPKVGDVWRLSGTLVRFAGYSALGKLSVQEFAVPAPGSLRPGGTRAEGVLRLVMLDGFSAEGRADLTDWVKRTAEAEENYWQGFTARHLMLALVPMESRRGVGFGRTVPSGGATVMIEVGATVDKRRLFQEWVLVHELIHTGMPYITGQGTWLMEGAATFVEPIIRARAGWKTEDEAWREWVTNMPRGAASIGAGLANGEQPYWAGAIFWLLADIGILKATNGAKGLEDCLGGVLWSGMEARDRASVPEFARACDRAVETDVVSTLIDQHFRKQNPVDLNALWKDLGVAVANNGKVTYDDTAPLAKWRKMIVMGPPGRPPRHVKLPWES
ncbi:MAG TPA: hypothetical protein VMI56_07325 [Reyranella sp.]|nr:hypothetical protein [Reyranella sp.]